jgi:hypothetical protein
MKRSFTLSIAGLLFVGLVGVLTTPVEGRERPKIHKTPPDLTAGGQPDDARDWRLGPIGGNGWVFARTTGHGASREARQILITRVDQDGPADGILQPGDVITGIGDKPFDTDARKALAQAINEAEKNQNKGQLTLQVFRWGKSQQVTVTLPVMGSYSPTAPFNCAKTNRIIDNAVEHMKANADELLKPGWIGYINGLGLLATGRRDVMPLVKELAYKACLKKGEVLSVEKHVSMVCWWWSYRTLFLCEYYLATGDEAVLPSIEELATKIALGQSGAGTWGHTYAARANTGYYHGHLGGYGAINQMGLTMMIVLKLAEECGVDNAEVKAAIKRGDDFFSYFIGKGTIPYGDHGAANSWFDDNGKSGSAAIFFDLMDNRRGTRFFSEMILASAPNGREAGHTGHYWSRLWGGIGAARGGDRSLQVFFDELNPLWTLERQPEGRFVFHDNVGQAGEKGDLKTKWDSTGSRLLQLCVPRRAIYITGKKTPQQTHLTDQRVETLLWAGRLDGAKDLRGELTEDEIFRLLADPLPPIRSIGADTLAEREMNRVDKLIQMLEGDNKYARYGAAEALQKAGFGSKEAADKLIELMAADDDVTFKVYAIAALINRDKQRGLLTVAKPAIPVLLKMAVQHSPDDPRRVLQHDIGRALFYNGRAQPRRGLLVEYGLDGVDRQLLIPAVKEILTNENGWARSTLGWIYDELTEAELEQVWGDIYMASKHIAPSGIMFASGIRTKGLKTMGEHHIKEGLDLAVWYIRYQKGHGSPGRVPAALEAILAYGPHAKRVIPQLEEHAKWWETQRGNKPDSPAAKIRATIEKIKAMPDEPKAELKSIANAISQMADPRR